jgi:hypothetical protein
MVLQFWLVLGAALGAPALDEPFKLWTGPPIPEVQDIPWLDVVTHVRIHAAVEGEYQFLHGASIVCHKGVLFASWANSPVHENSADEIVRARRSTDGGITWSKVETIAPGFPDTRERHSHAPFLSHEGQLWSFVARWGVGPGKPFAGLRTEAFVLDERSGKWQSRGIVGHDCWPCTEPLRMDDGNWITAGPNKNAVLPRVMISHGDDLLTWDTVSMPMQEGVSTSYAETTVIPDGKRVLAICRPRNPKLALVSTSGDYGRTWTPCRVSNYPMSDAKPYAGVLSTGQRYLVSNFPARGMPQRDTLVIAVSRAREETFSRLWKIRFGPSKAPLGGRAKARQWSYPYAHEHDGKLYVVYSISKEDCGLSIIPLRALRCEAAAGARLPNTAAPLSIGGQRNAGKPMQFFQGAIDEVKLWNRTLSDEEVRKEAGESR